MITQICECTKKYWTIHFIWKNYMVCEMFQSYIYEIDIWQWWEYDLIFKMHLKSIIHLKHTQTFLEITALCNLASFFLNLKNYFTLDKNQLSSSEMSYLLYLYIISQINKLTFILEHMPALTFPSELPI